MPANPNPPRLQLPPLNEALNRPPQPNDNPSVADVCNAICYEKEAYVAHADNLLDDTALVDAVIFKVNVVLARAGKDGAAPPWFHATMATVLAPITECLDGIDGHLNRIDGRLNRIEERLTHIDYIQAITTNHGAACGEARPFVVVPFLDGSDPTTAGDNPLPLLSTATTVEALPTEESKQYYWGYHGGGGAIPGAAQCTTFILHAIGCDVL